ncbi:MAG: hypothetical protein J6C52_03580 [Clostridia bacterium]|nr:hypothetical protein [Clostridia bacterium]
MKKCPKCQSIVDAKYECKVCGESIFYEPFADADQEYIAKGYRLRYWLPKMVLPLVDMVICIIAIIIRRTIDMGTVGAAIFAAADVFVIYFEKTIAEYTQWKYSQDYAEFRTKCYIILIGFVSILFSGMSILVAILS